MEYKHFEFLLETRIFSLILQDTSNNEYYPYKITFNINDIELDADGVGIKKLLTKHWFFECFSDALYLFEQLYNEKRK